MAAINLSGLGSSLASIAASIATLPAAVQTTVWNSIGGMFGGAKTKELQICAKMLQYVGNTAAETKLDDDLISDMNLPPSAAQVALDIAKNITTPGYDLIGRVSQMEAFINAGT